MINLHPAAPDGPTGTWQEVIYDLLANNSQQSGVMMHLVTPVLDKGPVASYCTFPIRGKQFDSLWKQTADRTVSEIKEQEGEENPLFALIRSHGFKRELPLIVATIQSFSSGEIRIENGSVVDRYGKPINGYDLTGEIEQIMT